MPVSACTLTRAAMAASPSAGGVAPSSTSGAPSTQVSRPAKETPLHFRAEEKDTDAAASHFVAGDGYAARMAAMVAFGAGSAAASSPMATASSALSVPADTASRPVTVRRPSVRVPVLSVQSTSTLARPSTAGSSWTKTLCLASRTTATAKATLVSSTRPSGTIPTVPAAAPLMASENFEEPVMARTNSSAAVGTIAHDTKAMIRLIPVRSSERTRVNCLACSASEAA